MKAVTKSGLILKEEKKPGYSYSELRDRDATR